MESSALPGVERIIVDGGSQDGTRSAARFLRADRILNSLPIRSLQLQAGYESARGDVLLFLDAATRLEEGWEVELLRALEDPRVMGGAFRLAYDASGVGLRFMEWGLGCWSRTLGIASLSQGVFARRKLLEQIGGVDRVPVAEDYDLARAIREHGRWVLLRCRALVPVGGAEVSRSWGDRLTQVGVFLGYLLDFDRDRVLRWSERRSRR